jgi:5-methylcytosine-specific restriction endonuclease McrA
MLSIKEQYEHPLWQKKKYEIYERDGWICRCCGKDYRELAVQLHAHHLYYDRNFLLWEYDNESIVTLCENCHIKLLPDLKKLAGILAFEILIGNIDAVDFINRLKQIK